VPEAGPSEGGPSGTNTAGQPSAKLSADKLAALAQKWVRVPQDQVKASLPCPVCKEVFKSEWSEGEEEWIWRNAVLVSGQVGLTRSAAVLHELTWPGISRDM
jgi:pre-mRNA cleavage complex 2 protein Pcf11